MKRLGLIAFLSLAACEQVEITQPPISVIPKNKAGAVGHDVYARDRARGNPVPRYRGLDLVQVRAQGNVEGEGYKEISGASCNLDAGLYSATFLVPANVNVPNYGPDSPAIFVRCEFNEKSGSITVNAINKTAQQRTAGAAGTGVLGAIIIGAVAAAQNNPEKDEFGYHPIIVRLK